MERPTTKEIRTKHYSVDGIYFTEEDGKIIAGGWQGRHFEFFPGEEGLMLSLVKNTTPQDRQVSEICLHAQDPEEPRLLIFGVKREDGWVTVDNLEGRSLAYSHSDVGALIHVFKELKKMQTSGVTDHFCREFGVVDDD